MLGSMDSCLPPKGERISLRRPLRQLSLGQDPLPASPLISTRNLIPGLSESVVQLDMLGKGEFCFLVGVHDQGFCFGGETSAVCRR